MDNLGVRYRLRDEDGAVEVEVSCEKDDAFGDMEIRVIDAV